MSPIAASRRAVLLRFLFDCHCRRNCGRLRLNGGLGGGGVTCMTLLYYSDAAKSAQDRANGHLDVLSAIPIEYRDAVLEQCNERELARGELIWAQGDPAQYVAFLFSGKAMSW